MNLRNSSLSCLRHSLLVCSKRARFIHSESGHGPIRYPHGHSSLLPLVLSSSNLQLPTGPWDSLGHVYSRNSSGSLLHKERVAPFYLNKHSGNPTPLGFLRSEVVNALVDDDRKQSKHGRTPWEISHVGDQVHSVSFASWVNDKGVCSRDGVMKRLTEEWRAEGAFPDILRGWSNETYPIFHPSSHTGEPVAFGIERAALPLFGFPNFGCLMIGYFKDPSDGEPRFWIPRRSRTKRTWPGRLDVTVGGGMDSTSSPLSTIIRECAEEASLPSAVVKAHIKSAGVLPFPNRSPAGWILPGLYYLYDLHLPPNIQPKINEADGEVEKFEVMSPSTMLEALVAGEFKPSSALAIVDFLVRHGYVTEEIEPRFAELCMELRKGMVLTVPWRSA